MKQNIVVRSGKDRLRYTGLFELTLMAILTPVIAVVLKKPMFDVGLIALVLSLKAMFFNLLYNWFFDRFDARAGRIPSERSYAWRIVHAIGFEVGLVFTSLPIVVWWLGLTIWQALLMDLAVTSFVVGYTFLFTLGYDRLFPVAQAAVGCRY